MKTKRRYMSAVMAGALFASSLCCAQDAGSGPVAVEPAKVLVAYYSYSGNTRFAAETIREATGGTLFEIKPAEAYSPDYRTCVERARKENQEGIRPALETNVDKIGQYDVIFVGTPNWLSTMAPPVLSFLATHKLDGKTVIPFVTHGGGGMARCEDDMRKACPKAVVAKGGAFPGRGIANAAETIRNWVGTVVTMKQGASS